MDQFKKSTSLSILRKMHFFSKQLFSHYLKMEKCPKTMEGLFQSSRVIRIGGPYFPIRTCMQNFSQILRVQFEKSPKLFFEGRVSFMPKPAGAPTPPPKRALNAYGARPPSLISGPWGPLFPLVGICSAQDKAEWVYKCLYNLFLFVVWHWQNQFSFCSKVVIISFSKVGFRASIHLEWTK